MASALDRIRCAVCERTMDEAPSMRRIASCRLAYVIFMCGDCLELPPETHIRDIVRGAQWTRPGSR